MNKKVKLLCLIALPTSILLTSCDTSGIQDKIETTVNNMLPNLYVTLMQLLLFVVTVLVFIFLAYKPIKKKLKERSEFVKKNIDESKAKNVQADEQLKKASEVILNSQKKASQIIQEAQIAADKKAQASEVELSRHIEEQKQQAHKDIEAERAKMMKEARMDMIDAALTASKEVLKREVNKKDNDKILEEFIDGIDKK